MALRRYSEEDVRRALTMPAAIDCMRRMFPALVAGEAQNQVRRRLFLPTGAVLHSMAGAFGGYFGTKIYATHPAYGAHFTFILYSAATGEPLAQFEANHLGQIRTGAATGYAIETLTAAGASSIGIIGSGFQADTQLEAVAAVRRLESVRVWSRSVERREDFARRWSARGIPVEAVAASGTAIRDAAIVITATNAKVPVLDAADVANGALVAAMGSNHPQRRELPEALVGLSRIVVDDIDAARTEAGDLLMAELNWEKVERLGQARYEPRTTIFKSVGLGVEDVAVAAWMYERYS